MTIGVLGRGRMGTALAGALAAAYPVVIAGARPHPAAGPQPPPGVAVADLAGLLRCARIVVLAVPYPVGLEVIGRHTGAGRVLVDPSNPALGTGAGQTTPAHRSAGEALAAALPSWRVVKAFNSVPAEMVAVPVVSRRAITLPLASEHECAKAEVGTIARRLGFEPVDAGGITSSRELEALAVLLASISRRHRLAGRIGFHLACPGSVSPVGSGLESPLRRLPWNGTLRPWRATANP